MGKASSCKLIPSPFLLNHAASVRRPFLLLTYATCKPLISWGRRNVAKLTLCATSGKKIGGSLKVYIVLSTVWRLKSAGSLANARAGF